MGRIRALGYDERFLRIWTFYLCYCEAGFAIRSLRDMQIVLSHRSLTPVIRAVYRLEARGREHIPAAGPLIVAGNHDSMLDPFVMAAVIPRSIHFVGKSELWRYAPLAWWLGTIGAIPVVRGGSDLAAVEAAVAVLEDGEAVGIFAARMALATGAPLLPVRLLDVRKALGRGTFAFPPLAALIGEPIQVERTTPTGERARALTDRLQAAVLALGT